MTINVEKEIRKLHRNIKLEREQARKELFLSTIEKLKIPSNEKEKLKKLQEEMVTENVTSKEVINSLLTEEEIEKPVTPQRKTNLIKHQILKHKTLVLLMIIVLGLKEDGTNLIYTTPMYYQELFSEQSTEDIVEMLYKILKNNKNIDPKYFLEVEKLYSFLIHTSVIDYGLLAKKFETLKIKISDEIKQNENGTITLAEYYRKKNMITIYEQAGGSEREFTHEILHMVGNLKEYPYLTEGITELLNAEYCENGYPYVYWTNVQCAKILCELASPGVVINAYCSFDTTILIQSLTNLCSNQESAVSLLKQMESYCKKDTEERPTKIDFEELQTNIFQFLTQSKVSSTIITQILEYLSLIQYPYIDSTKDPVLYFNYPNRNGFYQDTSRQKVFKMYCL